MDAIINLGRGAVIGNGKQLVHTFTSCLSYNCYILDNPANVESAAEGRKTEYLRGTATK